MDELISRAYVLAEYDRQHKGPPGGARKIMEDAPAVDAVPVVHGRWVPSKYKGFCECSECHDVFVYTEWLTGGKWSFCPNCGAKMDLEV